MVAGLRAAAYGLTFLPLSLLGGSEIPATNQWQQVKDPYSAERYLAIPAIKPDWAIIHVQQADLEGNARIYGSKFEDVLLSRAARHVLITCEELLPAYAFTDQPEVTDIPAFLVDRVVYAPRGAWPTSCYQHYSLAEEEISKIVGMRKPQELDTWLNLPLEIPSSPLLATPLAQEALHLRQRSEENV